MHVDKLGLTVEPKLLSLSQVLLSFHFLWLPFVRGDVLRFKFFPALNRFMRGALDLDAPLHHRPSFVFLPAGLFFFVALKVRETTTTPRVLHSARPWAPSARTLSAGFFLTFFRSFHLNVFFDKYVYTRNHDVHQD